MTSQHGVAFETDLLFLVDIFQPFSQTSIFKSYCTSFYQHFSYLSSSFVRSPMSALHQFHLQLIIVVTFPLREYDLLILISYEALLGWTKANQLNRPRHFLDSKNLKQTNNLRKLFFWTSQINTVCILKVLFFYFSSKSLFCINRSLFRQSVK